MARVLPFPVPPDPQLSAFPHEAPMDALRRINRLLSDPEIAVLRLQHEMLRLQRCAPFMDPNQTLRIQSEIELLTGALDRIEASLKLHAERQSRALGLTA